jgi:hypothetical protein
MDGGRPGGLFVRCRGFRLLGDLIGFFKCNSGAVGSRGIAGFAVETQAQFLRYILVN